MKSKIQVVENPDRFHVCCNEVPVCTFMFSFNGTVGVSKAFAQMNANSEAYKLALSEKSKGFKIELLPQVEK